MTPIEIMLAELESNQLTVVLAPSKRRDRREYDMIRVAASRNATWYQRFCAKHPSDRKRRNLAPDTKIRRKDIVRILTRLVNGLPSRSKYAEELKRISETIKK